MVKKISQNEFNEVTASEVAVIDFSATWCGPCKMLAPVLDEVSEEYAGKVHLSLEDLVMLAIISLGRLNGEKENAFIIRSPLGL